MEIHVEIAAETLFDIGPIPVTNSMLTMFIVMGLLLLAGRLIARNLKMVPGRTQAIAELIIGFILGIVEGTAGHAASRRLIPLVGGIFIFILFANFSGLLPGVGTVGVWRDEEHEATTEEPGAEEGSALYEVASVGGPIGSAVNAATQDEEEHEKVLVPFLRAPNADINMTLAMALVTFTVVQIYGIRTHGFLGRIKHMADPPALFPLELIGELSRIVSLSARLFGNIFAGEVLMGVMVAMANAGKVAILPLGLPVIFLFLEVLFGSIQALVFALLTTIYITLAVGGHGDHEEHAEHDEAEHGAPALAGSHGD
jgi:F-type H+-transporting ATPase subunit a